MKPTDSTVMRLQKYLRNVVDRYPRAWEQLSDFRKAKKELGGWPDWCDVSFQ